MKIITGNDLKTGLVIWWDGQGWSVHVEDAFDVGDQGEQILAIETAACVGSTTGNPISSCRGFR